MTLELWACMGSDCPTLFYRTVDGRCPKCGEEGQRVFWLIKPPRPPVD